jgi:Uma2 family endonuclease
MLPSLFVGTWLLFDRSVKFRLDIVRMESIRFVHEVSRQRIVIAMIVTTTKKLTKAEFWALADASDLTYELIDGIAVAKVSPKYFHARSARRILNILEAWAKDRGRAEMEWAFDLSDSYTPVPDLIYVSFDRLPESWNENVACPVPPELAIEIISPGQTFGQMTQKASSYLTGGVLQVWVVDPAAQSVTVFYLDRAPKTYMNNQVITDDLFPSLSIEIDRLF